MKLKFEDLGRQTVTDAEGKTFEAWVSSFSCEGCGQVVGVCRVDVEIAALGGNAAAFRASEDKAFVKGAEQAHHCSKA